MALKTMPIAKLQQLKGQIDAAISAKVTERRLRRSWRLQRRRAEGGNSPRSLSSASPTAAPRSRSTAAGVSHADPAANATAHASRDRSVTSQYQAKRSRSRVARDCRLNKYSTILIEAALEFAAIGGFSSIRSSRVVSINRCHGGNNENLHHLGDLDPRRYNAPLDARSMHVSTGQPIEGWMWGGTDQAQSRPAQERSKTDASGIGFNRN
jgi:hypothetical protein